MKQKLSIASLILILTMSCTSNKENYVLEVTTFKLKTTTNTSTFNVLDAKVEENFTSKQPGFIKRQSAVNVNGEYVVLVYWDNNQNADASMQKFMSHTSVADYASMIDGSTMKMSRFTVNEISNDIQSDFIEVMSFNLNDDVNAEDFKNLNTKVGKVVTAPKKGFVQRITGSNVEGKQVVTIYWDNKANSDAALQPFMSHELSKKFMGKMNQNTIAFGRYQVVKSIKNNNMELSNKDKVVALLNSFNTGDQTPISYINPNKYIQHNLAVGDGLAGFGEVMHHAPEGGFKANVVRAFEDGDYVFTHTEYDIFGPKAGFDVFKFEDGKIVEHWDNLLPVQKPNPSGRTQFDGATELTDLDKTEANKATVKAFIEDVIINHQMDKLTTYINPTKYIQHNPGVADGLEGFGTAMKYFAENGLVMEYDKLHKVLGQGNFVLTLSEGKFGRKEHSSFYDLFRLENGQIVEHWDVIEPILPKSKWKNNNGKF